jgi:hypothetical protein
MNCPHFDTDDFYWLPTDPPFRVKRPVAKRLVLMQELFLSRPNWVLSGSLASWSNRIDDRFTLAVYLYLDPALRRARLEARESRRLGVDATTVPEVNAFLDWSDRYEVGDRSGRNQAMHESWMATLDCPVLRLDSALPVDVLAEAVLDAARQDA